MPWNRWSAHRDAGGGQGNAGEPLPRNRGAEPPDEGKQDTLLDVENLEVVYNRAALAVQGVSFSVRRGSITVIVGNNGAGKTTTLTAVAGFLGADNAEVTGGRIRYNGHSLVGRRPEQTYRLGLVLVPEREKIFERLTVLENLEVPAARARALREGYRALSIDDVLTYFPSLARRLKHVAGYLSGGERQMLAIAQALLGSPTLLMVDELSMGLAPVVVAELFEMLVRLRDELGLTILLVEQNAQAALEIASYGYVFENGRVMFEGTPERLLQQEDVREFYLGLGLRDGRKSYREVKQYRRSRRWYG